MKHLLKFSSLGILLYSVVLTNNISNVHCTQQNSINDTNNKQDNSTNSQTAINLALDNLKHSDTRHPGNFVDIKDKSGFIASFIQCLAMQSQFVNELLLSKDIVEFTQYAQQHPNEYYEYDLYKIKFFEELRKLMMMLWSNSMR